MMAHLISKYFTWLNNLYNYSISSYIIHIWRRVKYKYFLFYFSHFTKKEDALINFGRISCEYYFQMSSPIIILSTQWICYYSQPPETLRKTCVHSTILMANSDHQSTMRASLVSQGSVGDVMLSKVQATSASTLFIPIQIILISINVVHIYTNNPHPSQIHHFMTLSHLVCHPSLQHWICLVLLPAKQTTHKHNYHSFKKILPPNSCHG